MEYRKVEGELGVSKLPIIAVRRECVSVGSKGGGGGRTVEDIPEYSGVKKSRRGVRSIEITDNSSEERMCECG